VKDIFDRTQSAVIAGGIGIANLMVATAAFASEAVPAEGGEAAGGINAILPPMGELIPATIAFLILLGFMSKFALPTVIENLDKRAQSIAESLEKAEAAKVEAEQLLAEYKQTMAEARKEASTILAQAKQSAEATRADAATRAQAEYDALLVKAREAIDGEKQAAIAELQASVARISVAVAGKLIGSELSTEDHLRVVEKYVNEAGSLNEN
jgi:F-type H+-transporting ATPase subunit b